VVWSTRSRADQRATQGDRGDRPRSRLNVPRPQENAKFESRITQAKVLVQRRQWVANLEAVDGSKCANTEVIQDADGKRLRRRQADFRGSHGDQVPWSTLPRSASVGTES
jgi:hypothetical protein